MLEDIVTLTGCEMIVEDFGIMLESVTLAMLGYAKNICIDKENTAIVYCGGKKAVETLKSSNPDVQASIRSAPGPSQTYQQILKASDIQLIAEIEIYHAVRLRFARI